MKSSLTASQALCRTCGKPYKRHGGRQLDCDACRAAKPAQVKKTVLAPKTLIADLVAAAEEYGEVRAQVIVEGATKEIAGRALRLRAQLIKSRHEVQKLKTELEVNSVGKEFDDKPNGRK